MRRAGWLLIVGVVVLIVAIVLIVKGVNSNEHRIDQTPTKADVYKALVEIRKSQRQACGVVNKRFNALANLVAQQRPNPVTTAYYRDHPEELVRARDYFDRTVAILRPRNCAKEYPPPDPAQFGLPRTNPPSRSQGPGPSKPSDRRTTPRNPPRPRKQASIRPPDFVQHHPIQRPARPVSPPAASQPQIGPTPTVPAPDPSKPLPGPLPHICLPIIGACT